MKNLVSPGTQRLSTKTRIIASYFSNNPMDVLSPKDVSTRLGIDVSVVRTIIHRLHSSGMLERKRRGRYRLNLGLNLDDESILVIASDMGGMAAMVLGKPGNYWAGGDGGDDEPMRVLIETLNRISTASGNATALNILRVCARRRIGHDQFTVLMGSVEELWEGCRKWTSRG